MKSDVHSPVRIDPQNPWPGLASFTEDAQQFFHGRSRETAELLRLVNREALTLLYGQSGLGKSSLLMAGLFPRLRADGILPVYKRIDFDVSASPASDQLLGALLDQCAASGISAPAVLAGETLWGYLHRTDTIFWTSRNRPVTPAFVIDQFEEVYTLGRHNPAGTQSYLEDLSDLVHNNPPRTLIERLDASPDEGAAYAFARAPYRIVLSMREDFFPDFRAYGKQFRYGEYRLQPMNGEQALEAVLETGRTLVEPDVAHTIVCFLDDDPDDSRPLSQVQVEPALLSVVCSELNEKRKAARRDRIDPDLLVGSQEAILLDFYRRVTLDIDPRARQFVQEKLISESGFRNSFPLRDAERLPGVTRDAIDFLVAQRLLRIEERSGTLRVELTHDVLTGVVQEFRDVDRRAEEVESLRREQVVVRRKQRIARTLTLVFLMLAVCASGLAAWSFVLRSRANAETERAQRALEDARRANDAKESALVQTKAAVAGQKEALAEARTALAATQRANEEAERANRDLVASNRAANEALRRALLEEERSDRLLRQQSQMQLRTQARDTVMQIYLERIRSARRQVVEAEKQAARFRLAFCDALALRPEQLGASRDSIARQLNVKPAEVCPE